MHILNSDFPRKSKSCSVRFRDWKHTTCLHFTRTDKLANSAKGAVHQICAPPPSTSPSFFPSQPSSPPPNHVIIFFIIFMLSWFRKIEHTGFPLKEIHVWKKFKSRYFLLFYFIIISSTYLRYWKTGIFWKPCSIYHNVCSKTVVTKQ